MLLTSQNELLPNKNILYTIFGYNIQMCGNIPEFVFAGKYCVGKELRYYLFQWKFEKIGFFTILTITNKHRLDCIPVNTFSIDTVDIM